MTTPEAIAKCLSLAVENRLDIDAVEVFVANYTRTGFTALNRRTGKAEPIRNEIHLERLLLAFCREYEHQSK